MESGVLLHVAIWLTTKNCVSPESETQPEIIYRKTPNITY